MCDLSRPTHVRSFETHTCGSRKDLWRPKNREIRAINIYIGVDIYINNTVRGGERERHCERV
jgi:hypothetical protein